MVADDAFGFFGFGIANEGTDARPGGEDVASSHIDLGLEVAADFFEDPVDFILAGDGVTGDFGGSVGGSCDGVALPREEEDDAPVRGRGIDEAHVGGTVVTGEDDMNAGAGCDYLFDIGVVEFADGVGKGAGSVDDAFSFNSEFFRFFTIEFCNAVFCSGAIEATGGVLF